MTETLKLNLGGQEFHFTPRKANELIVSLVKTLSAIKTEPILLSEEVDVTDDPIKVDSFHIAPHPDSSSDAILSLRCGHAVLQFAVRVETLMEILELLKEQTEPDPTSSHHRQ